MAVEEIKAGEFYESQTHRIWRRFLHHRLAVAGGCVILVLFLSTIFAAFISPHDPLDLALSFDISAANPMITPSRVHTRW